MREQFPAFLPVPFPMGLAELGGQLITAGGRGLLRLHARLLSACIYCLRAYDVTTGSNMGQSGLPAGGQATPIRHRARGRQMVVAAARGSSLSKTEIGDAVVACSPERNWCSKTREPGVKTNLPRAECNSRYCRLLSFRLLSTFCTPGTWDAARVAA